jgi:hypothetical protein
VAVAIVVVLLAASACSDGSGDDAAPAPTAPSTTVTPVPIDTSVLAATDVEGALGELRELAVAYADLIDIDPTGSALPVRPAANRVRLAAREFERIVDVTRRDPDFLVRSSPFVDRRRRGLDLADRAGRLYATGASVVSYVWEYGAGDGYDIGRRVLGLADRFQFEAHRLLNGPEPAPDPAGRQAWLERLELLDVPPLSELVVGDDPLELAPPEVLAGIVDSYDAAAHPAVEQAAWVELGLTARLEALRLHAAFPEADAAFGCSLSVDVAALVSAGSGGDTWPDELGTRTDRGVYANC